MDPDFEPTYTMYCGGGGDGGDGGGGGDASSPGDTGGAGGDDGAGGNDAGGASSGGGGGDSGTPSPGDTGGAGGDPSDPGSEAGGGGGGGVGGVSDTGDLGSEAANEAATAAANASVGAGGTSSGFAPSPAEVSLADVTAEQAAAAGLGVTAVDPGIPTETIKSYTQNLQAQIKSNPLGFAVTPVGTMAMVAAQTIAANAMMGGFGSGSTSGTSTSDPFGTISGDGDSETLTSTIAPYLLGNTQAEPSQVLEYFSNLQNQPQDQGLLSRYDQAKQNISGILGTNNQTGASNTSNFYYNYLTTKGLL